DTLRRPQADERVDDGPATEAGAGEEADRTALRADDSTAEVEVAHADELQLREVGFVAVRALLEHEHREPRPLQLRRDHGAAGTRADDAGIRLESRDRAGHGLDANRLRRLFRRRRLRDRAGIAEGVPAGIPAALVGGCI